MDVRWRVVALAVLLVARPVAALCPPDCFPGGGPAATDCLVEFGGIDTARPSCTDGDPACDLDGTVDGVCTFPLSVCLDVPGDARCTPGALSSPPAARPARSPAAQRVSAALATLDPAGQGCTAPGVPVALHTSLGGVAEGVTRLTVVARAGPKRDHDTLTLTCRPSPEAPSLSRVVEPIFAARCAVPACHDGAPTGIAPALSGAGVYEALVGTPALNVPQLMRVAPGNLAGSYLARKILGKRIPDRTARMPSGCPGAPPATGCLGDGEIAAILAWIRSGAPDN